MCGLHAIFLSLALIPLGPAAAGDAPESPPSPPWKRHVIDDTSKGADGVRLGDANRDGLADIACGWEEGGVVRIYLHPGRGRVRQPWPAITVGEVGSVEDAFLVDLDADGNLDVVSSCEGRTRTVFVHWAPATGSATAGQTWKTAALPASRDVMAWMYAVALQVDGRHGVDLVAGGKGAGAAVGWFESPADPRDMDAWKWHPLREVGWTMSLVTVDMDADGDLDVLASDRRGKRRGVFWLANPGAAGEVRAPWKEQRLGASGREVMFIDTADVDRDGARDVLAAVKPREIHFLPGTIGGARKSIVVPLPPAAGTAKAVSAGDIDGDGAIDLVFSCEGAGGERSGVGWLASDGADPGGKWKAHDISGPEGVKYDLVQLLDLDDDGDLDVVTCEERRNLGVIWYENPLR